MDIKVQNVTVKIGSEQKTLFRIPQLFIRSGEKILIRGASGQGKTTLLHLLAGLFKPAEGSIHLGDTEITSLSEEERTVFRRHCLGLVFQKLNLIEHLTALENIELSLRDKHDLKKATQALQNVGLAGREKDRTGVLSLGEQQRVAVARVLAGDSQVIFADEPTSSLDEANAFEVTELLLKACAEKTLIVVSHDHRIEKYFKTVRNFKELIA